MLRFRILPRRSFSKKCFYSVHTSSEKADRLKNYQHTVYLPKTNFPIFLKPKKVIERDEKIHEEAKFLGFYQWQRDNLQGEEFVLHDGPPYANGKPHMGHAINKILKDIILRSQIVQGRRVHYIPGWDCHGLPIELLALKGAGEDLSAVEIRHKAREVALQMSQTQMESFKQWGIIGDWENQCYYTFDTSYVVNQLQMFWSLFEKGLIYYDLKPVYWSPSSNTALAEAELLYQNHKSDAVTAKFEVIQDKFPEPVYLLVWTTTPWTLPLNKAVYCSPKLKYSIVSIPSFRGLYIIASELISELEKKLKVVIKEESIVTHEDLIKMKYKHPWHKNQVLDIFSSNLVKLAGTGLLHSVPGHGHDDYLMGLPHKLKLECFVDEKGRYTKEIGDDLAGLEVLSEGSKRVVELLSSDILLKETYEHNYPYDWRTKQPLIIRSSKQWFIDLDRLKQKALVALNQVDVPLNRFESTVKGRPYWCLSRQRKWGIPIPAFFHKTSGRPLLSKNLIHHLCGLFESSGPDIWWTGDVQTLFPEKFCSEFFVRIEDVIKGEDIMDIWFDSGISWSYALDGKISDLYLEGADQYTGWFQSSLLTSVAVRNVAPFKKILTHGFAVDEEGRKMSKSLGNVTDPETIVRGEDAFGVDLLRWWVAIHSTQEIVPVSKNILKSDSDSLQKIRLVLRFLLGALNDAAIELPDAYGCLDRYLLNRCYMLYYKVMKLYNAYNIQRVCNDLLYFVSNDVSSRYVSCIKDRLYCDRDTTRRRACLYTINCILDTLCQTLAPVVPHLIEEVYSYHPLYNGKTFFYTRTTWKPSTTWKDDTADDVINLAFKIKNEGISAHKDLTPMSCLIQVESNDYELLKKLQDADRSADSELCEILQVAEVELRKGEKKVKFTPSNASHCPRCRRYTATEGKELCERCFQALGERNQIFEAN